MKQPEQLTWLSEIIIGRIRKIVNCFDDDYNIYFFEKVKHYCGPILCFFSLVHMRKDWLCMRVTAQHQSRNNGINSKRTL